MWFYYGALFTWVSGPVDVQHTAYGHTPTNSFEAGKIALAVWVCWKKKTQMDQSKANRENEWKNYNCTQWDFWKEKLRVPSGWCFFPTLLFHQGQETTWNWYILSDISRFQPQIFCFIVKEVWDYCVENSPPHTPSWLELVGLRCGGDQRTCWSNKGEKSQKSCICHNCRSKRMQNELEETTVKTHRGQRKGMLKQKSLEGLWCSRCVVISTGSGGRYLRVPADLPLTVSLSWPRMTFTS